MQALALILHPPEMCPGVLASSIPASHLSSGHLSRTLISCMLLPLFSSCLKLFPVSAALPVQGLSIPLPPITLKNIQGISVHIQNNFPRFKNKILKIKPPNSKTKQCLESWQFLFKYFSNVFIDWSISYPILCNQQNYHYSSHHSLWITKCYSYEKIQFVLAFKH